MKKIKISRKHLELSVICALICAIFVSVAQFDAACEDMRSNVLRLHIIANSDSKADQNLKLRVRDAILECSSELFSENTDLKSATETAQASIPYYNKIANEVIEKNGFSYKASARIGESYFETREYKNFTLPAGNYESLIINLGEAKGKNWWCVVFPAVCIPTADGKLSDTVGETATKIAENPKKYVMKFKFIEIYEDLKKILKKEKNA